MSTARGRGKCNFSHVSQFRYLTGNGMSINDKRTNIIEQNIAYLEFWLKELFQSIFTSTKEVMFFSTSIGVFVCKQEGWKSGAWTWENPIKFESSFLQIILSRATWRPTFAIFMHESFNKCRLSCLNTPPVPLFLPAAAPYSTVLRVSLLL